MSLLVCAFYLQTVRGHAYAILVYACATRCAALGASALYAVSLYLPYHRHCFLILRFLLDTPHFNCHLSYLTNPSPRKVPRALLGESVQVMGNARYVDRKISRDFTEIA